MLTTDNDVVAGANVENASYGGAICAERTALVSCVMKGSRSVRAIAIISDQEKPISPCGICRQFIREFGRDVIVYMASSDGETYIVLTLDDLLPMSFGPENLDKGPMSG